MPWSASFENPIILPNGRKLLTLKDAADYVTKPPKKESDLPEWQTAIEVLLLCSRGGPTMMARIGVMKALNRNVEPVFNPERKETHWGKRKLKRDQCANLGGGDSLADLGIERPRCGAGIRRDRPLFLSVPVSERKTIVPGKIGIRLPAIRQTARRPRYLLAECWGSFTPKTKSPALGRARFANIPNVMKCEYLRSEWTQTSVRFVT